MVSCTVCEAPIGSHRLQCPNRVKTDTKKTLYCICYEYRITPGVWGCDKLYMHGDNIEEVRLQYFRSNTPETMRHIRIVGIAPAIGYFVDDTKGNELSL